MDRPDLPRLLRRAVPCALIAILAAAPAALAGPLLPEADGGSRNAEDIRTLYLLLLGLAVVVFLGVEGTLIWCLVKFRAKKGRVAAQIHGNTRLEIGWTAGAAVILVFLTVVTFLMLPGIKTPAASDIDANGNPVASAAAFAATDREAPPEGESLNIKVDGLQYLWRYQYPGEQKVFAYTDMYVPVGMTVTLDITSDDVAHSWWIPDLGGKMDALKGHVNKTWFKVTEPGVYEGQCAELCGRDHAKMIARVIALPFPEWKRWYDREAADIKAAESAAATSRAERERAVSTTDNP